MAFHGINYPGNIVPATNKTVLESIMSGREEGKMLIAGSAQAYSNTKAVNKNNELVGDGIYCSPLFTTCLEGYTQEVSRANQSFCIVLQCRIKP